jgi:hypothetical protein
MANPAMAPSNRQDMLVNSGHESRDENEKTVSPENIETILEAERKLTFRNVCSQYPKIVVWSLFWCMTAVACTF